MILLMYSLSGCASEDYARYVDTQSAIQVARYNAEAEKYKAMSAIAISGDTAAKVAAVMAMQTGNNNSQQSFVNPPKNGWEIARDFASIIIPSIVQGYSISANRAIATTMSNNSRDVSISTNSAFTDMAKNIQAPQANQNIYGNGVLGSGTYNYTTSANQSVTGGGVIGSGTHNPMTSSNNTANTSSASTDNHAVSTTTTTTTDNHAVTTDNHAVTTDNHATSTSSSLTCATGPC